MRTYRCRACQSPLFFDNSVCVTCGSALGYSRAERAIVCVDDASRYVDAEGRTWHVCANLDLSGCTWLSPVAGGQCSACDLTRTRPSDDDAEGLAHFAAAEAAKRHLVAELDELGFDISGLVFDMLSSSPASGEENVVIGHADGVITIDLAESDDARRERIRQELGEPYRTLLGHLRHEVGHYLQSVLVTEEHPERLARCRELFGDETKDYQAEIDRHYSQGPPADWADSFITTYATMHPFEDFAETFAHYLHISDTVATAASFGLVYFEPTAHERFSDLVVAVWMPLSVALNQINRAMGKADVYPFVIPPPVLDKLDFVASLAATPGP
ncbi:putative zinc-binding metallopeptidase [Nocardioides sp. zg-ZUI104]|uniref:zinc-binding metallopeptidase family protein n=1 Tax=Nocardioides faecalis TaxID=2803858 RepID=UPI001BCD63D3|nr:putative zinc-binding metallopeptidase [Nocardioides faecalis]MBS4752932.1 putative zinc-binding metallopeptidase [Nocardioides faecalis]